MSKSDPKKKKGSALLDNLLGGERRRHQVAMITEEGEWNQHESNSGMARVFVVMLLIHVVLIGSIIIYDFVGTDASAPAPAPVATKPTQDPHELSATPPPSTLPETSVASPPSTGIPSEGTYVVKSGDSLPSIVAQTGVDRAELIALNGLDSENASPAPQTLLKLPAKKEAEPKRVAQVKAFPQPDATPENTPPANAVVPALADALSATVETPTVAETPVVAAETPPSPPVEIPAPAAEAPKPPVVVEKTPEIAPKAPPPAAPATAKTHTIEKGDTLYSLSRKYGVSVAAISKANNITDATKIQLGAQLKIPAK